VRQGLYPIYLKVMSELDMAKDSFIAHRVPIVMMDECMTIHQAREHVEQHEWPEHLSTSAPECVMCEFLGPIQLDQAGTGDSPSYRECILSPFVCPWGK
jgi:hypothetical protein